ncbi:MAG: molybdenum cofactor guanylyltransferase [Aequorivita sp.]
MKKSKVTGVILAGGKNSRMGTDKGLLLVDGKRIVERAIEAMRAEVDDIIIISNGSNYDNLGYKVYRDIIENCGPMGGILTALSCSSTDKNFVVSCDMPFLSKELVGFIIENSDDCEIAIPKHGEKLEPLCAVYDKSCRKGFEELLQRKELKLLDALLHFRVKQIPVPENFSDGNCFHNINTLTEYETLKLKKNEHTN